MMSYLFNGHGQLSTDKNERGCFFSTQNFFWTKIIFNTKNLDEISFSDPKLSGPKCFSDPKFFQTQNFFSPKFLSDPHFSYPK